MRVNELDLLIRLKRERLAYHRREAERYAEEIAGHQLERNARNGQGQGDKDQ